MRPDGVVVVAPLFDQHLGLLQRAASPADAIPYRRRMLEAQTMPHRDWLRRNDRRHELMVGWEEWFETHDLLLCPAASSPAVPHDQAGERHDRTIAVNGRAQPIVDQLFWAGYPCGYYLPSTVAPIGLAHGLPVGIQVVGQPVRRSDMPAHGRADRGGLLPLHVAARALKSPATMTRRPGFDPGPHRIDGAYGDHPRA